MELKILNQDFAVCKVRDFSEIDLSDAFCFIGKTDEEPSLVCSRERAPQNAIAVDAGWKAFRAPGGGDFSLIGNPAKLSSLPAEHNIGIFAISIYNTDYILTKAENFEKAVDVLKNGGYEILL